MAQDRIIQGTRFHEILREDLRRALERESVATAEDTEYYLVMLLSEYQAFGRVPALDVDDRALGVRYVEAMTESTPLRASRLRSLAETTLITLGFFVENLQRGIVGLSHYQAIGGSSYQRLAQLAASDAFFSMVYAEMATKFIVLTHVLKHLAPWNRAVSDAGLVRMYRRWMENRDADLAELLEREGIAMPAASNH